MGLGRLAERLLPKDVIPAQAGTHASLSKRNIRSLSPPISGCVIFCIGVLLATGVGAGLRRHDGVWGGRPSRHADATQAREAHAGEASRGERGGKAPRSEF